MKNQKTKRILVVDDNQEIHNDFAKILTSSKKTNEQFEELEAIFDDATPSESIEFEVQIDSAFQGQQAIEMVRTAKAEGQPYSLAFVDVRMPPGMDGIATTQEIWAVDPEIQIVVCSAYSDYSWKEIVEKLKFADRFLILKKPFESIEVRQLVSALHQRWLNARSDDHTNLVKQRVFQEFLQREIATTASNQASLACVMVDLDFFKHINDVHGIGDQVIRKVAEVLETNCQLGDSASRFEADSFCVMLRDFDETHAVQWANQVRNQLQNIQFSTNPKTPLSVTASFGVAQLASPSQSPSELIDRAKESLRMAKQLGRDRVVTYSELAELPAVCKRPVFAKSFTNVPSRDVMSPTHPILRDAKLSDAAKLLINHEIDSTPVVDESGTMVGVLSEGDLLRLISEQAKAGLSTQDLKVRDAMCSSVVGYSEDTSLQEIFDFIVHVSTPQVVIVRDGQPCGVISRKKLLECIQALSSSGDLMTIAKLELEEETTNH